MVLSFDVRKCNRKMIAPLFLIVIGKVSNPGARFVVIGEPRIATEKQKERTSLFISYQKHKNNTKASIDTNFIGRYVVFSSIKTQHVSP